MAMAMALALAMAMAMGWLTAYQFCYFHERFL
jgi:hypothetical protein